eukprot:gb/GECH01009291.1/.p1 GENE.gb/GECH01009291.1/~~gb/GECH01009291.1/.p1  ORF type:complete len:180 (+),score=49.06 gb/GECH01009291.1/:1-540(+)
MSYVDFVTPAVQHAREAAELDEQEKFQEALNKYMKSIDFFMTAMKHENQNPKKKQMLKEKCLDIMERAEQIKKFLKKEETQESNPNNATKKRGGGGKKEEIQESNHNNAIRNNGKIQRKRKKKNYSEIRVSHNTKQRLEKWGETYNDSIENLLNLAEKLHESDSESSSASKRDNNNDEY